MPQQKSERNIFDKHISMTKPKPRKEVESSTNRLD